MFDSHCYKRLWYGPRAAKSAHWLPLTGDCQGSGESIIGIRFQMSPYVNGFHGDIEVIYQQSPRDNRWLHHWSIHFMSTNLSTSNLILRNQMSFQLPNRFGSGQCCAVSKIWKRLRNCKMRNALGTIKRDFGRLEFEISFISDGSPSFATTPWSQTFVTVMDSSHLFSVRLH